MYVPPRPPTPPAVDDIPPQNRLPPSLQFLADLIGTTVTISTKTGQTYRGAVNSASRQGGTIGVMLKDVEEISAPRAPSIEYFFITSTDIATISTDDAVVFSLSDFVSGEKQRLAQKKQAVFRAERDKWTADFVKFSQTFKLKKPIPDDLVPILTKHEEKQKQIREKTKSDAVSENARAIRQTTNNPLPPKVVRPTPMKSATKPNAPIEWQNMIIQTIPPFKGKPSNPPPADGNASAKRLDVSAFMFKPNPESIASTPRVSPATTTGSSAANKPPKPKPTESARPNPSFKIPIKKTTIVHVEDDLSPFEYAKAAEPSAITTVRLHGGKRCLHNLPSQPPTTQQHSPHLAPPAPLPIPPPLYEGDSVQQAAQSRSYVYAYPQYYPGPSMMPGMGPPPPGSYMPWPYMHPIHYPLAVPPPNATYPSPSMGQMPPHSLPPGAYPPLLNGGGPQQSMPSTLIPAHTHPYYSQGPQRR